MQIIKFGDDLKITIEATPQFWTSEEAVAELCEAALRREKNQLDKIGR